MAVSRYGALAVVLAGLAASACQSQRFASSDPLPEPLPAAPTGAVTSSAALPPPSQFPAAPAPTMAASPTLGAGTNVASVTPAGPPPEAKELTPATVGGVWSVSVSGQSCKMATSQTKYGQGFRAGPLRCPAPMDGVKSWSVAGKQLSLYDESGSVTAKLYSTGDGKFDGQTSSGAPVSFTR